MHPSSFMGPVMSPCLLFLKTIVSSKSKFNSQGNSKFIKTTAVCPYYISTGMFSGVASKIIPILDPEFVASSVVDATLSNKEIILLPWWSTYLFMLKVSIISSAAIKMTHSYK